MSFTFDAALKDLLKPEPEDFVPAFRLPSTRPVVSLDVDLSTLSAATDVAIGFGKPLQEIVDLNFQSGPDRKLPGRCHLYNVALNFRYDVPVRTIIVLLRPKSAFILTGMRVQRDALGSIFDGVKIMHESSAFDLMMEEGLNKGLTTGLAEGLNKGLATGLTQGRIEGEQRIVLHLGGKRLGPPDEGTIAALKAIEDLGRLERLAEVVNEVASWQELLAIR